MSNIPVTHSAPPDADAVPRRGLFPEELIRPDQTHSTAIGYILWAAGFLGFFGAHRFYYGKPVTGVIWTLTGGLLLVGWVVDLFLIPRMDARAERRYVPGPHDYTIAWILSSVWILGVFGFHRFYLGKWVTGLIWLLTAGLLGLGWVWDLCTLNEQVDGRNRKALRLEGRPLDTPPKEVGRLGIGW